MENGTVVQNDVLDGHDSLVDDETIGLYENKVRTFAVYEALVAPLQQFLEQGDGVNALSTFDESLYPDAGVVDASTAHAVRFISTAFGRSRLPQGYKIVDRIVRDNPKTARVRFRSRHPLFVDGSSRYQNVCLVSAMVHLGIPILPYFDGVNVLDDPMGSDGYIEMLRSERMLRLDVMDAAAFSEE